MQTGPCSKVAYRTRGEANIAARHIAQRRGRSMRSYKCEYCGGWHLSKQAAK